MIILIKTIIPIKTIIYLNKKPTQVLKEIFHIIKNNCRFKKILKTYSLFNKKLYKNKRSNFIKINLE